MQLLPLYVSLAWLGIKRSSFAKSKWSHLSENNIDVMNSIETAMTGNNSEIPKLLLDAGADRRSVREISAPLDK
jgi:hypothetical protein